MKTDKDGRGSWRERTRFQPFEECRYIAFNKPYGVLSQFTQPDESDKRTLSEFGFPGDVYPIGRLDYDSEGLLLLSDDKRLNQALLDPSNKHERIYLAQVENVPQEPQLKQLREGVVIDKQKTQPAKAHLLTQEPELWERTPPIRTRQKIPTAWLRLTLHEGRNRQVRRMTAAIGCPTLRLVRAAIGDLQLEALALAPGDWRLLTREEILLCFRTTNPR